MRKVRHIIGTNLPDFLYVFLVNETKIVLRLLQKGAEDLLTEDAIEAPYSDLIGFEQISSSFLGPRHYYYMVDTEKYGIVAEAILNKNDLLYKRDWYPGQVFYFWLDGIKGLSIDSRDSLAYFLKQKSPYLVRKNGGFWPLEVMVINSEGSMLDNNFSITSKESTKIITNLPKNEDGLLGERWEAETVMNGNTSGWLNLEYELTTPSSVIEPDGWATFTFTVKDGQTHEVATNVNWNNYTIEAVDGYAPHKRFAVTNGVGTFKVRALDLQEGETLRVKVNRGFYTGLIEAVVPVAYVSAPTT